MKKYLLFTATIFSFSLVAVAQHNLLKEIDNDIYYQIPNSGFEEEWEGEHIPSLPWQSFGTAKGSSVSGFMGNFIRKMSSIGTTKVEG